MLSVPTLLVATALAAFIFLPVTEASEVYVKLYPGRELCIAHSVYRDPEADPVKVSFSHRALSPRLAHISTRLFAPSTSLDVRGTELKLDLVDSFGSVTSSFFDAEESGIYTICLKTPRHHPILPFEFSLEAANDFIAPIETNDGGVVVDKPVELSDYEQRLSMLDVSVKTTRHEIRSLQLRRFSFDEASQRALLTVVLFSLLNLVVVALVFFFAEKILERYFIKNKLA